MASYKITVQNDSGASASYIVTAEKWSGQGSTSGGLPIVLAKARVSEHGKVRFTIAQPEPCYAYSIFTWGKPEHGTVIEITDKTGVTLGKTNQGGEEQPGTTLDFDIVDGMPSLRDNGVKSGMQGAFAIQTGQFAAREAKANHLLIGYGSESAPWSVLTPEPAITYQIRPTTILYLTAGDHSENSIVDVDRFGESLKLDFSELADDVRVTQGPDGRLKIEN